MPFYVRLKDTNPFATGKHTNMRVPKFAVYCLNNFFNKRTFGITMLDIHIYRNFLQFGLMAKVCCTQEQGSLAQLTAAIHKARRIIRGKRTNFFLTTKEHFIANTRRTIVITERLISGIGQRALKHCSNTFTTS